VSDDGPGAAIVGFAAIGITYLLVESIVTFLLLGIAFGVVAVITVMGSIVYYVYRHPIRTARGWTFFLCGSATLLLLPFIFMYFVVMHGHTEIHGASAAQSVGSLFAFACLVGILVKAIPALYQHFEQQRPLR
jgi:hypothetical protein